MTVPFEESGNAGKRAKVARTLRKNIKDAWQRKAFDVLPEMVSAYLELQPDDPSVLKLKRILEDRDRKLNRSVRTSGRRTSSEETPSESERWWNQDASGVVRWCENIKSLGYAVVGIVGLVGACSLWWANRPLISAHNELGEIESVMVDAMNSATTYKSQANAVDDAVRKAESVHLGSSPVRYQVAFNQLIIAWSRLATALRTESDDDINTQMTECQQRMFTVNWVAKSQEGIELEDP